MENETLLKEVTAKAQTWLGDGYDEATKAEVRRMLDNDDKTELIESFYKDLEFGTGGLRGIMGAGTNRMNIYTVGAATQGLSNYLKKEFADLSEIKVVIGHDCRNNSRLLGLSYTISIQKANCRYRIVTIQIISNLFYYRLLYIKCRFYIFLNGTYILYHLIITRISHIGNPIMNPKSRSPR